MSMEMFVKFYCSINCYSC